MVPFPTIPPSESFGWKDFFDSLRADEDIGPYKTIKTGCLTRGSPL